MKHERATHRASIAAFFKYATLDEIRELDKARMRIAAERQERLSGPNGPTCCPWHRSGGLASIPCRDTVSDDGGWNDGAAMQMAAITEKRPRVKRPKYAYLRDFLDALAKGRERKSCEVVEWTSTGIVEIRTARGVVLFRSESTEAFVCDFAMAFGMKGRIS